MATQESQEGQEAIAPNATVYIKNLEEKLKIPDLTESLREIFSEYGTIVDIIAKKSLRRKGQAFIVFDNTESAEKAIEDLDGFELAGKEMKCQFAKSKSDATVKREGTEQDLDEHVRVRKEAKERKQAAFEAESKKRPAAEAPAAANKAKVPRPAAVDDTNPPHKVLIVEGIPEDYDEEAMVAIFNRFTSFKEYHAVAFRKGLGFAHFEDVAGATAAKTQLSALSLGGSQLTVTYQKA